MSGHGRCGDHFATVWAWMTEQFIQVFGPLVFFQGSFLLKRFLALGARMPFLISRLAVDAMQVPQQVGILGESPATVRTQVGSLSGVDPLV